MNSRRNIIRVIYLVVLFLLLPTLLHALTAYDYDTENYVEFDQELSAIQGKDITIYDYSDESEHTVQVISVKRAGNDVKIEVKDYVTGKFRTFEMEIDNQAEV